MRRMAEVTQVRALTDAFGYDEEESAEAVRDTHAGIPGLDVFEINGTFCFGATQKFSEVLAQTKAHPRVVILKMRNVLAIDATGLQALEQAAARFKRNGAILLLVGAHAQPLYAMERSGLVERLGEDNLFETFPEALQYTRTLLGADSSVR
jgi:SulP family sulfate permease